MFNDLISQLSQWLTNGFEKGWFFNSLETPLEDTNHINSNEMTLFTSDKCNLLDVNNTASPLNPEMQNDF